MVIVKESSIEGKGAFADRNYKKGDVVLVWDTSIILTEDEVNVLPEEEHKYLEPYNNGFLLQQPPARFVNHSCNPNTKVVDYTDVAIKDIKKGEEITSDYGKCTVPGEKMHCNCGTKNCRRIIEKEL